MRPPGNGHDTPTPPPTTYRDATTGLHPQSATTGWLSLRIARSSRGPLSPPPRQGTPDASWSRYVVVGWQRILQEPAHITHRARLQHQPESVVLTPPITDQLPIDVIDDEEPLQISP